MPATLTTVSAITKEVYQGRIRDQLNEEAVISKRIGTSSKNIESTVGGKYVTFPIRVSRNAGLGYRNEGETLMASGQQGYSSVRVGLKYGYGRVKLTGQTMDLVDSNYQAFASAMDQEMTGLKDDIAKDVNRIYYGDSTGTLATVATGVTAGVTIVAVDTVQYLEVGQMVDVLDTTGATPKASNRQITAISGLGVTLSGANFTSVATDILVRTGNYGREPNGFGSIIKASAALFNVDPATYPVWKSTIAANGGTARALSEGLMIKLTDDIRTAGGGRPTMGVTSLGVRRAYFALLSQQRRYADTKTFDGGIQGLAFHNGVEIPIIDDIDHPHGKMSFINEGHLTVYQDKDWTWLDTDGHVWKWVLDNDAFEAVIKKYWEIGTDQRNAHGQLQDITEG